MKMRLLHIARQIVQLCFVVACWLLYMPNALQAQPVDVPAAEDVVDDSVEAVSDTMPQLDTLYIDNSITEAEMNSLMMTADNVVEATPTLMDSILTWIADLYVIAPLLMLAVIVAVFWLVKRIHRLML